MHSISLSSWIGGEARGDLPKNSGSRMSSGKRGSGDVFRVLLREHSGGVGKFERGT
jgi:hypothetical protein